MVGYRRLGSHLSCPMCNNDILYLCILGLVLLLALIVWGLFFYVPVTP